MRNDGRSPEKARKITITPNFTLYAEGSVLVETGNTKVICTASVENEVPGFLKGKEQGWVSAEYGMLPRSTSSRMQREAARGKQSGRTLEIQRLIGRSLRSVVDLKSLGERTVWMDCDVIQADGGTRTASITGSFVALVLALRKVQAEEGFSGAFPIQKQLAAISLGIVKGKALLDLDYSEDSEADVDMNIVMTNLGEIIEIQGTAEKVPFTRVQLTEQLNLAEQGIAEHFKAQLEALDGKLL